MTVEQRVVLKRLEITKYQYGQLQHPMKEHDSVFTRVSINHTVKRNNKKNNLKTSCFLENRIKKTDAVPEPHTLHIFERLVCRVVSTKTF